MNINFERLKGDILELGEIGLAEDRGLYRMAFTDADIQARHWLRDKLAQIPGVTAYFDGAANVVGRWGDQKKAAVVMGSHLDTVPGGGKLDGALGVLMGLEVLRVFAENGFGSNYPVEVISFSDEEGRFGGMLGSRALAGEMTPDLLYQATDLEGIALADAMKGQGWEPLDVLKVKRNPDQVRAFVELHIEQGPILDQMDYDVGIVTAITGLFKWSIRLVGSPDHAGTTPMDMRRDALQGLAEFSGELPRLLEENGSEESKATIGRVELFPGSANTVPGTVEFSLDVREKEFSLLQDLKDAMRKALSAIARRRKLMFEFDVLSEMDGVACDGSIQSIIEQKAKDLFLKYHYMPSGAAHDAQMMSALAPMGMIFVPSINGRSHSSAEWTHWEDIESGASLLLQVIQELALAT